MAESSVSVARVKFGKVWLNSQSVTLRPARFEYFFASETDRKESSTTSLLGNSP